MRRNRNLNVVVIGNFLYPEGMAESKRIRHLVDGIRTDRDSRVRVLLLRQSHAGRNNDHLSGSHDGIPFHTIGADLHWNWRIFLTAPQYLLQGISYLRKQHVADAHNVVVLYTEPNIENFLFVAAARIFGYRIIVDIVEDNYLTAPNGSFASRLKAGSATFLSRRITFFADAISAVSGYLVDKYRAITADRIPVHHVPVSVDLDLVRPAKPEQGQHGRIFYAGSFGEKDGVEHLIAAFEQIAERFPDTELILAGQGTVERMSWLRQRIDSSVHNQRIHYLGFLSAAGYFRELTRCGIPCVIRVGDKRAERGFPFKLGEFLATGRPVVATSTGDIPSYLVDKKNACLVEPDSPQAIRAALEFILDNPTEAELIGTSGRVTAQKHFDARSIGARFLCIIEQLDPTYSDSDRSSTP